MRVFLSSVRTGLEEERDNVASILNAVGHQVIRFEDFGALNATSRVACLEALHTADCYLLLLGPRYGSPVLDSGLSPTEEEFNAARTSGIPVLVFKKLGVDVEPDQAEFSDRVGTYPSGRFWATFTGLGDLLTSVVSAVQALPHPTPPIAWRPVAGLAAAPIHDQERRRAFGTPVPAAAAIVEVHVIPVEPVALRPTSSSHALRVQIIASMRATHFVEPGAQVDLVPDPGSVHLSRPSNPTRSRPGFASLTTDPYRGVRLTAAGESAAYMTLPSDFAGSLTNESDLTRCIQQLLEQVIPYLPSDAQDVAVAACLMDEGRTSIGSPDEVGTRTSGSFGHGRPEIILPADRSVTRAALEAQPHEVAREVAARLCEAVRERR